MRVRRLRLGERLAARHRELDDQLAPDLELGALGVELATAPGERGDPLVALPSGPRLVVEHGDEPLPVLTAVQPQHGAYEATAAQPTPMPGHLEPLTVGLEALDHEGGLRYRDITDGSSHAR